MNRKKEFRITSDSLSRREGFRREGSYIIQPPGRTLIFQDPETAEMFLELRDAIIQKAVGEVLKISPKSARALSREEGLSDARQLAKRFGVKYQTMSTFLSRLAEKDVGCRRAIEDHRGREPHYMYVNSVVIPLIRMKFRC